ncbi:hypothetical protein CEXT_108491 [Caerostris extrusa]|uniref:Uncharacterized protein n=1 Tax=Caerostris extrusa TaxID=172846 RepID=A0AAV4SUG8_CAEEX|nr:hypothetical protein CEXT_108491 [Caerostris extrusa]
MFGTSSRCTGIVNQIRDLIRIDLKYLRVTSQCTTQGSGCCCTQYPVIKTPFDHDQKVLKCVSKAGIADSRVNLVSYQKKNTVCNFHLGKKNTYANVIPGMPMPMHSPMSMYKSCL